MTEEDKQKFFEEQEAKVDRLRKLDPMAKKDFSIVDKKVEKKKPYYWGRYKNFNRWLQDWKRLWD